MKNEKKGGMNVSTRSFITAIAVILVLMILTYALTLMLPSGVYGRVEDANGNVIVDTNSGFRYEEGGISFWKWLLSPVLVLGASGNGALIAVIVFLLVRPDPIYAQQAGTSVWRRAISPHGRDRTVFYGVGLLGGLL